MSDKAERRELDIVIEALRKIGLFEDDFHKADDRDDEVTKFEVIEDLDENCFEAGEIVRFVYFKKVGNNIHALFVNEGGLKQAMTLDQLKAVTGRGKE